MVFDHVCERGLRPHRSGYFIGGLSLRLRSPRTLAETGEIAAAAGEPGGKRCQQGNTPHGGRAKRLDKTEHGYNSLERNQQTSELNTERVNRVLTRIPDDALILATRAAIQI